MMWHDSFSLKNSTIKTYVKCKKLNYIQYYVIPNTYKTLIITNSRKNYIYIKFYSQLYYLIVPLPVKNISLKFDVNTNQILIKTFYNNIFNKLCSNILTNFIKTFNKPIFRKINFKGKGYYIYKNYRNTVTPQFGYSHRLYLYTSYLYIKFLSKNSLIIFGLNLNNLIYTSLKIVNWRSINIFTGRGVRFSKQIVYKKSGKISTYK